MKFSNEINNESVYYKISIDGEGNVLVKTISKKGMLMPENPGFSPDAWEWLQNKDNWPNKALWAAQDKKGYCGFFLNRPYMMWITNTWLGAYLNQSDKKFTPIDDPVKISRKEMFNET